MSIVDKKLVFILLFCSMLSCASQKQVGYYFTENKEEIEKIEGIELKTFEKISVPINNKNDVSFSHIFLNFNKSKKDTAKSLAKIVSMAAYIFSKREADEKGATVINESINTNTNEIFKTVDQINTYASLLNHIKNSTSRDNTYIKVKQNESEITQNEYDLYKKFAKKVVFFDATFKHSETAKKRFLDTVSKPVWEHHCLDNSFIYENFDYENLLKHMKKLKERQKKYCFFMIVKEDKSHGLVVFNRTNVGIIELICIGLSEKNQKFIQTLINFQNQNMLENSIVMFLLVQYSLEIAEEKIKKLGLENNLVLKKFNNIKPYKEQCYSCSEYRKKIDEFLVCNKALNKEIKKIRIVNWLNDLLANICTNACIAISVFGLTYWLMLLK